ncbi:MAG: hypothetical protein HY763_03200 [Planctomycetes bacterium]|nr:hypothetical protein [Planctomycetota bacterium]
MLVAVCLGPHAARAAQPAPAETVRVTLRLCSGGRIAGPVIDHNNHGLVVENDGTPYVFAWMEIEGGSALVTRRALMAAQRGHGGLTARDHFELGSYALRRGRSDLAFEEFSAAAKRDKSYRVPVEEAWKVFRATKADPEDAKAAKGPPSASRDAGPAGAANGGEKPRPGAPVRGAAASGGDDDPAEGSTPATTAGTPGDDWLETHLPRSDEPTFVTTPPALREKTLTIYKAFGENVREVMGKDVELVETDHFLIWTDWEKHDRQRLADWCEAMYVALAERFGITPQEDVFLAKCPVFCWRTQGRFRKFARQFDGYDGKGSAGYSRSIERKGHVHLVLVRESRSEEAYDRFACTLMHEGTHAFLHRLHTTRLIPHWINEGFAEMMAGRVLGERCPQRGNAELLSRQYVRYQWPIAELLAGAGPIAVHQYALAHSVIAYLDSLDEARLVRMIRALKEGRSTAEAIAEHFDGMTLDELDARWREAIRTELNAPPTPPGGAGESPAAVSEGKPVSTDDRP